MRIGEAIRSARIAKGMTQEQLGNILGVQKSAIAKYESGRVINIKRSTMLKLSEVLGLSASELILEAEPEEKSKDIDELVALQARIKNDSDFRKLILKINKLKSDAVSVISNLADVLSEGQ